MTRRARGTLVVAAAVLIACSPQDAWVRALRTLAPSQTVHFASRDPSSTLDEFARRMRFAPPDEAERRDNDFAIEAESFELYVPPRCSDAGPAGGAEIRRCGLIAWISPHASGHPPPEWQAVLDARGLLWVGANRSGNERALAVRVDLALAGAASVRDRYSLSAQRQYVAGFSGGGRCASVAALLYPDVFAGGLFFGGADFFGPVLLDDGSGRVFAPPFPPPERALQAGVRERGRYVLLTGSRDFNRDEMRAIFRGYQQAGIRGAALLEVPGLGHALPNAAWFERAVTAVDGPGPP